MTRFTRFAILCVFFSIITAQITWADGLFLQRLSWSGDANALEYKVEIQNLKTKETTLKKTSATTIEVSLPAGTYQYRVYAYDMLGKEASVSNWQAFEIVQANLPKIQFVESSPATEDGKPLALKVDITNITEGSTVELVNEMEGSLFKSGTNPKKGAVGAETKRAKTLYFDAVPPGKWRLKVTNPSGLSTESEVIDIRSASPTAQELKRMLADAQAKNKTLTAQVQDGKQAVADAQAEKEAIVAEVRAEKDAIVAEMQAEKEEVTAKMQAEIDMLEAETPEDRDRRRMIPGFGTSLSVGAGPVFSVYDGSFSDQNTVTYLGKSFVPAVNIRFSVLPLQSARRKFGFEVSAWGMRFVEQAPTYDLTLSLGLVNAALVYHHRLVSRHFFLSLKAGGGVCLLQQDIAYREESSLGVQIGFSRAMRSVRGAERSVAGDALLVPATSGKTRTVYPLATAGAAIVFIPFRYMTMEAGADFSHVFISDVPTGFVLPYVTIGIRL